MYTEAGIARVAAIGKRANRRDFTPYFDAADARNGMDLGSPRIDGLRNALAKKDVNQKLRQNSAEAGEAVTEKLSEPRAPPRASLGKLPSTAPKLQSKAEIPALLKAPRASVAPASGPTSYQRPGALTPVVEAPSPLNISSTNQSNRPSKHRRTSTLDRILDIRAEEQAKALTQLEGELYKSSDIKQDEQQTPNPSSHRVGNVESRRIAHPTLRKDKQQGSNYNTSPDSSENQNGSHIRTISDSVAPDKRVSASSSVYSNDENRQEDEIVRLSKAIVGLRAFQDLPSSSLNKAALQRKSAVPDGLDMSKIGVGKRESNDGNEAQQANREKRLIEAQAELLEYFNVPLEATGPGKADAQTSSSQESCVTASSGDYEKIGSQETLEQEENGVKRRWYKGFRRV
ncbi:hypothetical protein ACET3X_005688 [Alternaria dauci]|uniref:Uncharacterized protein n=1 Tax=Alternaria dauci TaxID=48095 RepID=A0ABR3UI04_9PLEO